MNIPDSLRMIKDDIRRYAPDEATSRDVTLIAVSKNQPIDKIQAALDAGHRVFGENRVQEAAEHWADLRAQYDDVRLHLIGPLQTNKVKQAVALFDEIHTLDREKLAQALSVEMRAQGKNIPCFVQVNTGEEPQKSGVLPQNLSGFLEFCREICGLDVAGLMCIPPVDEPPALHFALLRKLAQAGGFSKLSMGMSGDYPRALALGATHIRVGSALFGER